MLRVSQIIFIFLLLFSPLAFGTVETWSLTVLETGAACSFLLLAGWYLANRQPGLKIPGMIPLFLLLGLMLVQLIPLPASLVKLLSPSAWEIYRPLLELDPERKFIPLTVSRKDTLYMLFTFTAYALVYILTIHHCARAEQLKQTASIIAVLAAVIAIEAIIQKITSPHEIYWFRATPNSNPVGPWVYSNHFSGFMGMLFPPVLGLFFYYRPRIGYANTLKEKIIAVINMPGAYLHLLLGTGAMLIAVSIFMSISRGGIITMGLALVIFTFLSARTSSESNKRWVAVLTILAVMMIWRLGWQPIIEKFGNLWGGEGFDVKERLPIWRDTVNLVRMFPLFGSGFGTFVHVYPAVRTLPGDVLVDHVHNDYIELLANGGLTGFALAAWFVLAVLYHVIRMLLRRRDRYAILLTSGVVTGLFALLFHSLADFQMYNGANGLYFFFLCGLAVSAVHARMHFRTRPTLIEEQKGPLLACLLIPALALLIGCSWYKLNVYTARRIDNQPPESYLSMLMDENKLEQTRANLAKAARRDPLESRYPFRLGRLSTLLGNKERARREYMQACLLRPTDPALLQQLAFSLEDGRDVATQNLLELALRRNPYEYGPYLAYSNWLLKKERREEAFAQLNRAMDRIPLKTREIVDFIFSRDFSTGEIELHMAGLPLSWYMTGLHMEKLEQTDRAEKYYRKAIELAGEQQARPEPYYSLYNLYRQQNNEEKSQDILRLAISRLPDNAFFRIRLGEYYEREGIYYRAREEYAQALRIDPVNPDIRVKLMELSLK